MASRDFYWRYAQPGNFWPQADIGDRLLSGGYAPSLRSFPHSPRILKSEHERTIERVADPLQQQARAIDAEAKVHSS